MQQYSPLLVKHPRIADEFCVTHQTGVTWYRAEEDIHRDGWEDLVNDHNSYEEYHSENALDYETRRTMSSSVMAEPVRIRCLGSATLPSWLRGDNNSGVGKNSSTSTKTSITTAALSPALGDRRLCLLGLNNGSVVSVQWDASSLLYPREHRRSAGRSRFDNDAAASSHPQQQQRSMDVMLSLGEGNVPVCSTFLRSSNVLYSVGTDLGKVLLYDVSTAFHSGHGSAPPSAAGGGGGGCPFSQHHQPQQRRSFGAYTADSTSVPLTTLQLQGRITALEAVDASPLVVAASRFHAGPSPSPTVLDFGASSLVTSFLSGSPPAANNNSVVSTGIPVGGGTPILGGSLGSSGERGGGLHHQHTVSGTFQNSTNNNPLNATTSSSMQGATVTTTTTTTHVHGGGSGGSGSTGSSNRYTLQLMDLRVASQGVDPAASSLFSNNNGAARSSISNGGVVFGGGIDIVGASSFVGVSRGGVFAEHVAVHPTQPLIATCGTMSSNGHGSGSGARRNRSLSRRGMEIVQLWDVRQPGAPTKIIRASCAPHVALRWKPAPSKIPRRSHRRGVDDHSDDDDDHEIASGSGDSSHLVGITTSDVRVWTFHELELGPDMAVSRQGFESGTEAGTEDGGAMWTTDDQQQRRGGAMYYGSDGSSYHHGGGGTDDNTNNVGGKGSSIPRASSVGKQAQIGRGGGGSSVVPTRGGATDEGTTSAGGGEATTTIASQAPQPPVTRQHQLRKSAHSISHGGRSTNGGSAGEGTGGTSLSVGGALSTSSHHHHPFLLGGIAGTVSLRTASTIKGGAASIIPLRPLPAAVAVENSTSDVGRRRSPSMNQIREEASAAAVPKLLTPPFVADFVCIDRSRRRYQNGPSQSYREGATAVCNNNTEFNLGGEMNDEPLLVMLPHRQPLPAGGAAETTTRHPSSVASAETVPPSPVLLTPYRGVVHSVLYSSNGGHKADDGSTTTSGVAAAAARLTLVALGRNVCIMSAASSDVFIAHDDSSNEDVDQQQHGNETYNVNAAHREAPHAITVSSDAAFTVPFVAPSMGLDSSPVSSPEGVDTAAGIATTMWRRVKCTTQSVTTNASNTQLRRERNNETGGGGTQQKPYYQAGAASSPRHGNSFTSDRPNALRTLVARREIDAFFAMRYTALVRGCHVKRTLPVSKYPPGIIDLIRGAVGGSARSKEVYSTCVMLLPAKQGVAFCEWHATDDPLRTLLLQAMGWVPCAEDAKMLQDSSSSRSSPTSRGPVDDGMILNFVPRLTSLDLVAPTQSMQEAVERRVGILLLCHRSDLAVAMLMHYSTLHRTYATLAALLRALCDAAAVIPSPSMPPSTSPNALHLATRNFARLRWLHTDLLQLCGGQWLRGLLGVFIWARLQDASNYALKQLEATFGSINRRVAPLTPLTPTTLEEAEVKWVSFCKTEEQAAAVEACRRQVRRPDQQAAAPHVSSTNNGHSSSPSSICSSIGWPAPAWRALYASPEAACLTPSHRIEAMQRAVERHARYALGVALLDDPTPEALEELCRAAVKAVAGYAAATTGADGPASNNTAASRRHQQQQQHLASTGAFPLGETTLGGDATLRFGNATTGTTLSLGSVDDEDEDTRTEEINALTDLLLSTIEHHDDRAAGGTLRSNNGKTSSYASTEPKGNPSNRRYSLDDEEDKRTETSRQQERPTSAAQNMLSLCGVNGNAQLLQNCLGLPITDRVALAALLLPDNSVLYATLKQMATRSPSLASSPLTAVFYGCGDSGARHMQTYVDTTGDVQLAACLFSPYCRPRSSVLPTTHNNTGSPQPHVTANTMAVVPAATPTTSSNNNNVPSMLVATTLWNTWNRVYCAALNARGAFHERARHDRDVRVAQTAQLQLERQAKEEAVQRLQQQQQLLTTATVVSSSSAASPSASLAPTFRQHHHHHGSHASLRSAGSHHLASTSTTAAIASQQLAVLRANDTAVEVRCSCGQPLHDSAAFPVKQQPVAFPQRSLQSAVGVGGVTVSQTQQQPTPSVTHGIHTSCSSEVCPPSAHQVLCAVCVQTIGAGGSGVREGPNSWLTWCTACLHGGHYDHIQSWFAKHQKCPVDQCMCHCCSSMETTAATWQRNS